MGGVGGYLGAGVSVRSKEASWTFVERGKPTAVFVDPVPALSTPEKDLLFVRDVMFSRGGPVVVPPGTAELLPCRPISAAPDGPDLAKKCWSYRPEWSAGKPNKRCSFFWVITVADGSFRVSVDSKNGGLAGTPTGFTDCDYDRAREYVLGLGYGYIPQF